ncbi:MAG: hypothetical protein ACFFA6_05910 [Promethearchaeota archaeon]
MSDLIVVDITEKEKIILDGSLKQKEIIGKGKLIIKNPSAKSRLWNLTCDLKENINTSIKSRELELGILNPTQQFIQEYEIRNLKEPKLKISETFDTDISITDKINNTFLFLRDNKCKLKLILKNLLDLPILDIKLSREMPKLFQDIEILTPNLGIANIKEEKGKRYLSWEIISLERKSNAELEILCTVNVQETKEQPIGSLTVTYLVNNYKLTLLDPEIRGLTDSMSGIDRDESTKPGIWDCNVEFINESGFQVRLENVKVSHRITTGTETLVSQAPNKLLNPDQSWSYDFQVENQNVPELSSSIEFTPLYVVITRVIGEIKKESTICSVLSAAVDKTISPCEVDAYANTYMTIHNMIVNNGSAKIKTLAITDEIPKDFIPPELKSITIRLFGADQKTLDISSRSEFTQKLEIDPESLEPTTDHKIYIELFNLENQFLPEAKISVSYSLLAKNPNPETMYNTPITINVNSSILGKPYITSPAEIPNIKIKYVKRKLKTLKSIKPGMMEGEFSINLHIQNKGSVELENIILKDKIPKGFNLADFTPPEGVKHEVIKTDEESELQLKIPELKGSESIKINYNCAGMGDYPRYEPEVIVQGKKGSQSIIESFEETLSPTQILSGAISTLSREKKALIHELFSEIFKEIDKATTGRELSHLLENMRDILPPGPLLHQFMQFAKEIKSHEKVIVGSLRDEILAKLEEFKSKYS